MRIRLRVADATHKLEVQQTLEELLVKVGELVRCQPADVRVGLNKQVHMSSCYWDPPPSPSRGVPNEEFAMVAPRIDSR